MKLFAAEIRHFIQMNHSITSAWFGGSAATGRDDALSDIDLVLVASDTLKAFKEFEGFLSQVAGIELIHVENRRKNYDQRFYILKDTPETYYLDVCIFDSMEASNYAEYFNHQRHGTPVIIKDDGLLTKASQIESFEKVELDKNYFRGRSEIMYRTFLKEAAREKFIDAYYFYYGLVNLWVSLMRIKQAPQKHDFSLRYINVDLDEDHALYLENALKISSLGEMRQKAGELMDSIKEELV